MSSDEYISSEEYAEMLRNGTPAQQAAMLIIEGEAEAEHHRRWYIDQALRIIAGRGYSSMIKLFRDMFGDDWDTGIAP